MAKPRKTGRALVRTYIRPHDTLRGLVFQARVIDARAGTDIKCSAATVEQAVDGARTRAVRRHP